MMELTVIAGPTASGKTGAAVEYCLKKGGEVVSCDSMQIYRGMEILSACATPEERRGVPHHMLGIADPTEKFSAGEYREKAAVVIEDILARGKQPVLCGGTGLYWDSLTRPMTMGNRGDENVRRELEEIAEGENGRERLHAMLEAEDPERAKKLHVNDVRRVVRALEIRRVTGITQTELEERDRHGESLYTAVIYALDRPRDELYRRIDQRCEEMFRAGLADEVRSLADTLGERATSFQAIGYKELLPYIRGEASYADTLALLQQATRNYAKRQLTWLRRDERVVWIEASGRSAEEVARKILEHERDRS